MVMKQDVTALCPGEPVNHVGFTAINPMRFGGNGEVMKKFYYETWLPFISNKRRILILAIASYIALC